MSKRYLAFKIVPGLIGIPLMIIGATTENTVLLIVGLVLVGIYATEMAVITPVKLARERARKSEADSAGTSTTQSPPSRPPAP